MHYTNNANLPEPMVKALMFDDYEHEGDISGTGLITPPRILQLQKRHDDEITIDVLENFWKMLGQAMHLILEKFAERENVLEEQRLYLTIAGWKIAAKPDLWFPPHILDDYKFTSVWTVIFGLKREWEEQLNIYRPFYEYARFPVKKLRVHVLGRDWSRMKSLQNNNYPKHEITTLPVPMWDSDVVEDFIHERVLLHQKCEELPDDKLPYCTPEERWEKKTTWAVMKEGRKSALRVFDKAEDAYTHEQETVMLKTWVEQRLGESTRCEHYCHLQKFCNQFKEIKEV